MPCSNVSSAFGQSECDLAPDYDGPEVFVLTDLADLLIEVRDENDTDIIHFKIHAASPALKLASAPLRRIVDPGEGLYMQHEEVDLGGRKLKVVKLYDSEPKAVFTLLAILHYKYTDIPDHLHFHELKLMAVVTDKYDCATIVRPWLDKWVWNLLDDDKAIMEARAEDLKLQGILAEFPHKPCASGHEGWLMIGNVFRAEPYLRGVVRDVSLSLARQLCETNSRGDKERPWVRGVSTEPYFSNNLDLDLVPIQILGKVSHSATTGHHGKKLINF
ncbi:hypothetical protein ABW19_dt0201608 [Dactylella cylindrospora]|nr:hypothetical protein ABW19_dt0201608 [Dactylella cylindrospora]